jgi:hypothetical protein
MCSGCSARLSEIVSSDLVEASNMMASGLGRFAATFDLVEDRGRLSGL